MFHSDVFQPCFTRAPLWAWYTSWFKYKRDKLWLVYTQIVPVIFEPPCTSVALTLRKRDYLRNKVLELRIRFQYINPNDSTNLTVTQLHTQVPTLCLSFFSNICLILKPCLDLKREEAELLCCGCAGDKGSFDSVLNLKYFIQALKVRWPIQKLLRPPNFPSFPCGRLETLCDRLGSHVTHVIASVLQHHVWQLHEFVQVAQLYITYRNALPFINFVTLSYINTTDWRIRGSVSCRLFTSINCRGYEKV
jgi:hypothetical protein